MGKRSTFRRIAPILLVIFLGYVGFSLPLPIFPAMFLDPDKSILPISTSPFWRNIFLGLTLAAYPLGQFFGCPVLGKLSDRFGRRPVLLTSLLGVVPTYVLSALGVSISSTFMLLLARFLCGIMEGNIVIALASIADQSSQGINKQKYFGKVTAFASAGFVVGPLIGGKLVDPSLVSWFNFSTPFWAAALFVFTSFFFVYSLFEETKKKEEHLDFDIRLIFNSLFKGFNNKQLKPIYRANFFIYLSLIYFFSFFPVYLLDHFKFTPSSIAEFQAYISAYIVLVPFFYFLLPKKWSSVHITMGASVFFAIGILLCLIFPSPLALWGTTILPSIAAAFCFTFASLMISDRVSESIQGEMLGINQSMQFLAEIITGVTGGILASYFAALPQYVSAASGMIAAILLGSNYWMLRRIRHKKTTPP